MTLPTPERVREILATGWIACEDWPALSADVKAILADWLRLVTPAPTCKRCGGPMLLLDGEWECHNVASAIAPTPSAQAKCEQHTLTADERDAIRRAYWKSVTPVASAQAREALEAAITWIEDVIGMSDLGWTPMAIDRFESVINAIRSLSANVGGGGGVGGAVASQWRDIATAPRDGTLIALLIEQTALDESNSTSDVAPCELWQTIGFNHLKDTGEDVWQFAGWDWCQDEFTAGHGVPKRWMPLAAPVSA